MDEQTEVQNAGSKLMGQDGISILNTDINKLFKKTKPFHEADAEIIQLRIVKKNNAKRKTRLIDLDSYRCDYEYILFSQRFEKNNLVFWTIIYTPTGTIYEFETDQIIKRLDILGKMPAKDTVCIAFSAGMKCVLQEANMQKG